MINRLTKAQREAVISWVAEGLQRDEISKRAAAFSPPFEVSYNTLYHYRKTRAKPLAQLKAEGEASALTTGLALAEERVNVLVQLAERLQADLFNDSGRGFWLEDAKMLGQGEFAERYEFERYNAGQVSDLRGVLDDIAKEVGGRQIKIDQTQKVEVRWNWEAPAQSNI